MYRPMGWWRLDEPHSTIIRRDQLTDRVHIPFEPGKHRSGAVKVATEDEADDAGGGVS